jgi:hypothetical protein
MNGDMNEKGTSIFYKYELSSLLAIPYIIWFSGAVLINPNCFVFPNENGAVLSNPNTLSAFTFRVLFKKMKTENG